MVDLGIEGPLAAADALPVLGEGVKGQEGTLFRAEALELALYPRFANPFQHGRAAGRRHDRVAKLLERHAPARQIVAQLADEVLRRVGEDFLLLRLDDLLISPQQVHGAEKERQDARQQ